MIFLKLVSTSGHDNYMSLWWHPLLLQSTAAGFHLLRSMQLHLCAVMELLADKTLTTYYSRSQRASGEKRKEKGKERQR